MADDAHNDCSGDDDGMMLGMLDDDTKKRKTGMLRWVNGTYAHTLTSPLAGVGLSLFLFVGIPLSFSLIFFLLCETYMLKSTHTHTYTGL